jgi:exopolysaccharide production protein ExoZ
VQTVSLASTSIASLVPVVPSRLLVIATSGIVVALGLLLNIRVERPLLNLCRRIAPRRTAARLIPVMRASGE